MKVTKYFTMASLMLSVACNSEESPVVPESGNQPVDAVTSVALPGPDTRIAMDELWNTASDQGAASVEKLHMYLVTGEDIVLSKEFTRDVGDFTEPTSATVVGAKAATGGCKFLDVDNNMTKTFVIANPQGALVNGEGKTVVEINEQQLKAQINEVIYAGSETLTTVGTEPCSVNPQEDKRTVKKAEFTLIASMSRFQVTGTKFVKVTWKNGKETETEQWCTTRLTRDENKGKSSTKAWTAFKAGAAGFNGQTWDGKSDIVQQTSLSQRLQAVEVATANQSILMNRFSKTLSIPRPTVEKGANWFWAKTYAGDRYRFEDGTLKPDDSTDLSEVASYLNTTGFDFAQRARAIAFNFFVNGTTDYGKENNAPELAFVFGAGDDGVSVDRRFIVTFGYVGAGGEITDMTDLEAAKGGYLTNLDLAALNEDQGILVDVDPSILEGVTPEPGEQGDLEGESVNVIVRVEMQPRTAVNVLPALGWYRQRVIAACRSAFPASALTGQYRNPPHVLGEGKVCPLPFLSPAGRKRVLSFRKTTVLICNNQCKVQT